MGDEPAQGPDDRNDFDQRLAAARSRAGLDKSAKGAVQQDKGPNPFSVATRLGAEMVASLVVSAAIGYGLDRLFHSAPWFMIGFVPIGAAAGLRNVFRAMGPGDKD